MNHHIKIGEINTLIINRESDNGLYLLSGDNMEVLLPNAYVTETMRLGDEISVFVYRDSEDRLVATTLRPKAKLGEFALLEVIDKNSFGFFVDWGLPKDLFVPLREQKNLKIGDKKVFIVTMDVKTDRVIASQKIGQFLDKNTKKLTTNQKVSLMIIASTPLGYKAIIDNRYEGMLYQNEIFEPVKAGDRKEGYIKTVRKDGKIDLSLQPIGQDAAKSAIEKVKAVLDAHDGLLACTYKSDAQEIQKLFGLSKKAYKKALTELIEEGSIELRDEGIKKR